MYKLSKICDFPDAFPTSQELVKIDEEVAVLQEEFGQRKGEAAVLKVDLERAETTLQKVWQGPVFHFVKSVMGILAFTTRSIHIIHAYPCIIIKSMRNPEGQPPHVQDVWRERSLGVPSGRDPKGCSVAVDAHLPFSCLLHISGTLLGGRAAAGGVNLGEHG